MIKKNNKIKINEKTETNEISLKRNFIERLVVVVWIFSSTAKRATHQMNGFDATNVSQVGAPRL